MKRDAEFSKMNLISRIACSNENKRERFYLIRLTSVNVFKDDVNVFEEWCQCILRWCQRIIILFLNMMILKFNSTRKFLFFFRNEIDKLDRKSRVKKTNKDKISAFRNSSMRDSRLFRDFIFKSESQSEFQFQFELIVNSFIVIFVTFIAFIISIAFVVSIAFVLIDNATLLKILL
jgi:hypothetical protein